MKKTHIATDIATDLRRDASRATRRCMTVAQVCEALQISRSTFNAKRRAQQLPMLEELKPRIGRSVRFRADLIERWLNGQWGQPRLFRRSA